MHKYLIAFVAFNPLQNNNSVAVRRRKLIAKIDEQIQMLQTKTTHLRNTSGLLTNMVTNAKILEFLNMAEILEFRGSDRWT